MIRTIDPADNQLYRNMCLEHHGSDNCIDVPYQFLEALFDRIDSQETKIIRLRKAITDFLATHDKVKQRIDSINLKYWMRE